MLLLGQTNGSYAGVLCGGRDLLVEGQLINLIAISEGSLEREQCCKRHPIPRLKPEDRADPLADGDCHIRNMAGEMLGYGPNPVKIVYEFYDVLWVEFIDGVAYRKDIGRVRKEVWDRETLGWVDFTLG